MWFRDYVPVGVRIERAQKKLKKFLKKNPEIVPIVVEGHKIVKTWWGKAWANNLRSYADYENRIGRGRSYVKNGFVFHLEIKIGRVESLVIGAGAKPYNVEIDIMKLSRTKWEKIVALSKEHIVSLSKLLEGRFPKEMREVFSNQESGIFPTLNEIKLCCSCPDWATMCKHVSAALFAVGVKLDKSPELMFKLRGVDEKELIDLAIQQEKKSLRGQKLSTFYQKTLNLSENKLSRLFNINLNTPKVKKASRAKISKRDLRDY